MTVGVMRPVRYREECEKTLGQAGADMLFVPFIEIRPLESGCVHEASTRLERGVSSTAVFTSANGVDVAFKLGGEELLDVLKRVDVVAIGPRTKRALAERNISSSTPPTYASEGLVEMLTDVQGGIEVLRSAHGDVRLMEALQNKPIHECVLYEIVKLCKKPQREFIETVVAKGVDALLFTSRMGVESFFECARDAKVLDGLMCALSGVDVVAIGPPTKRALEQVGVRARMPAQYTFSAMVELLEG
ncbi:MAG: uroporphyrinogen-III synthase [Methermicoccaceae archaeon]